MGKVFSYIANELIVKTLANNKSFQRFAVKIDSFVASKKEVVLKNSDEYIKAGHAVIKEGASKVHQTATEKMGFDFQKFASVLQEEIKKDLAQMKGSSTSSTIKK